ncbi:hypothetical protein [Mesorhizobium sp.]|uniref:hypothetical protein n=1 Tax=Mesorhizobium sp. TaxID=1871066 RepID=UPI000FE88058|nr:hypothetical protein [Mesorhizobium sp.]RWP66251.1 MAG: hypothetical protein EOR09_33190 [Mesorhizobium sp.]
MPDPFESPLFLIARTKENLSELDAACNALFDGDCSASVVDIDPKTGNKTFKLKFTRKIPGRIRHIAATALSDLRHALDQASVASVKAITKEEPDLLYFPFAANPNDLVGRLRKSFPDEIHPTFLWCTPYPTGEGYKGGNDLLAQFSKASGPNKHQITCKIGGHISTFRSDSFRAIGTVSEIRIPPAWDIDENELVIGTTTPWGYIEYNFQMSFYVALAEAGQLTGQPASPALHTLLDTVENIVTALRTDTKCITGK